MTGRVGGELKVSIDGQQRPIRGSFSVKKAGKSRKAVVGQDGVHGYTESSYEPEVRGEVRLPPFMDPGDLRRIGGSAATLDLADGRTFVLTDPQVESIGDDDGQGRRELHLGGVSCEEI